MKTAERNFIYGLVIFCMLGVLISNAQHTDNNFLNSGIQEDTSFARLQVEKAKDYVIKAQFDSAIICYKEASNIYYRYKIHDNHAKCLNYISEQYIQMGNLTDALVIADSALKESIENSIIHETGKAYNNKGAISTYTGFLDTAVVNFEMALSYWLQEDTEDIIPIVVIYTNMAFIERSFGDYEKSLDYTYKAIDLLISTDKDVDEYLSYNYNNLGIIYHLKGRFDEAIIYYNKAMHLWLKQCIYG